MNQPIKNTTTPPTSQGANSGALTRILPSWLAAYSTYTQATEAPPEFHMWTGVSTIAAALNRKCWIDMGTFNIYPSMFIIFVAPPGIATKSTTAGIGSELLEETEVIHMASASGTWQGMLDELEESERVVDILGQKNRISICPMHVFASELGTFLQMSDGGMIDVLTDLWDGKNKFKRRTKSSGQTTIPRPYINLIGCTTPSWLLSNAEDYFIGGGFFSRTIFVYASEKDKLIAYPDDTFDRSLRSDLLEDLKRISKMSGAFTLTKDAKEYGSYWYEQTYLNTPEYLSGERFQGYIARRQNHLHKAAMVVSASERSDKVITLENLQSAEHMLQLAEGNLVTIYDSIVTNDKVAAYKKVKNAILQHQTVERNSLYREMANYISLGEFEDALRALVFSREIKTVQKGNNIILKWNP